MGEKMMSLFGNYVGAGQRLGEQMIAEKSHRMAAEIFLDNGRCAKVSIEILDEEMEDE